MGTDQIGAEVPDDRAAEADDRILIELDERRRVSLGRVGRPEHRRYLAHTERDGTIVLTPAVVLTETEAALLANPELTQRIEQAMADPDRRMHRRPR